MARNLAAGTGRLEYIPARPGLAALPPASFPEDFAALVNLHST